jgi:undecaprenyl-diphosphatase
VLVAISRIVLGLHYPSDVVVGGLIGAVTAAISFNLL